MKHSNGIGIRIAFAIGMAAMIVATGAFADPGHGPKDHGPKQDDKKGGDKKPDKKLCTADTDCKNGYRCAPDGQCRNQNDVCRNDGECKDGHVCGIDAKCHDAKDVCKADTDCPTGQRCAADAKCHKIDKFCASDADCKDGARCGDDHTCRKSDGSCTADTDCADGQRCWDDGRCRATDKPCIADTDCKDDQYCSDDGKCHKGDDCDDQNGCTIDRFAQGHCIHYPIADCESCQTAADCDDTNACTTDVCLASHVCEHVAKDGCARCTTAADCADGDSCTTEACAADGSCQITKLAVCPAPKTAVEICGDCIDNDGNGLTDFEDPACCSQRDIFTMQLDQAGIRRGATTSKVNLQSNLAPGTISGVNALTHDVFMQIRPANGSDLLCARIPAGSFLRAGRTIRFTNPKSRIGSARGLNRMVMRFRRDGSVRVKAFGRRVQMGTAQVGPLQFTIGFASDVFGGAENRCSASVASFRTGVKSNLLVP